MPAQTQQDSMPSVVGTKVFFWRQSLLVTALRNAAVPIVINIETLLFLAISLRPANVLEEGNVANEHDFTETMVHSPIMQVCGSFIIWRLILIMEKSTLWQTL